MGSRADEDDNFISGFPYQEPIWFNVTLPTTSVFSG